MSMTEVNLAARADLTSEPAIPAHDGLPINAQIVLKALRDQDEPMKAYGLLEVLQDEGITAPMTVYRALDRLIEEGLVRKIGNLNAYAALPLPLGNPVVFVICRKCQRTTLETIDPAGAEWLHSLGINARDVSVEAFRDCPGCDKLS